MIYTSHRDSVKILSATDVDQQHVRCEVHYTDGRIVTRTIAVFDLNATGGINEIMARIKELTGEIPE